MNITVKIKLLKQSRQYISLFLWQIMVVSSALAIYHKHKKEN